MRTVPLVTLAEVYPDMLEFEARGVRLEVLVYRGRVRVIVLVCGVEIGEVRAGQA